MKTINIILIYSLVCFVFCCEASAQVELLKVIPEPQNYHFTSEKFMLDEQEIQLIQFCKDSESLKVVLEELKETFNSTQNISLNKNTLSKRKIIVGLPNESSEFKSICIACKLDNHKDIGVEGYELFITSDSIIISANEQTGLFYGIQTLKQIIRGSKNLFLPGLKITDWPSLKVRAIMDDISRGPVPTVDFMKYQIRRLAEMKINMFNHYIEHVVKTKSHPEFAPNDGSITIEEWKELSEYAKKYNITLVGGFQSFGHFNNILNTPEYKHLGESGTLISPVLEESYKFLEDIYSEMIPAFKSPYFNINCDETFDLGKEASKDIVDSLGYAEVYFRHIMRLYEIVKKFDTKLFMWGDVLLEHPELFKKLPKDVIILTWNYDDLDDYQKLIQPIKEAGYQFMVCPGILNSNRLFPFYKQAFGNVKGFITAAQKSKALGTFTTIWDDGGNAFFSNDWYGVAYAADKSWNPQSGDSVKYDVRINSGLYQTSDEFATQAIWKLNELSELEPTDGLSDKVLFEKLIPEAGKPIKISLLDWKKVLSIANEAEELINKSHPENYEGDKDYILFACKLYQALAKERLDLVDAVKYYSKADSFLLTNPIDTRKNISNAIGLIEQIIQREEELKSNFEKLWLRENHTYSLNKLIDNYQNKINDFNDVKIRLVKALQIFDDSKILLSKEEVRLSISELPGKYFREWLMVNPIPNKDNRNLSQIDYLKVMGGEKNAIPKVTQEFYLDSVKYRWSRVATQYQDVVNLSEIFKGNNHKSVVYAFANIDVKKDTTVQAAVGVAEGIEIFVNGKSIYKNESSTKMVPDQFQFSLLLNKGINNLMLKICVVDGDWGFSIRLPGCDARSRKNRYKIISE